MHDEVVAVVAWLFRSLRLNAIVEPTSVFDHSLGDVSSKRPDVHMKNIRSSRKSGKQVIIDVALTGVDGQSRTSDEAVERPLQARYGQKVAKYGQVAEQSGERRLDQRSAHGGRSATLHGSRRILLSAA